MAYVLSGLIGPAEVVGRRVHGALAPVVPLVHGLAVRPLRSEHDGGETVPGFYFLTDEVVAYAQDASRAGKLAYVEVEFHGGVGEQRAIGWEDGRVTLGRVESRHEMPATLRERRRSRRTRGAVNEALRWLGIPRVRGRDEFDTVGLGRRRDWHDEPG